MSDLQLLFDVCADVLKKLDLPINVSKSNCIRIGPRFKSVCSQLTLNDTIVKWTDSIKFLGVTLCAGKQFNCCFKDAKSKFYTGANTILGRLGTAAPASVLLHLINTQCLPSLLYGTVATGLSKVDLSSLNYAYNSVFVKIFKTSNPDIILNCQYYSGCFTVTLHYEYQRYMFLNKLMNDNKFVKNCRIDDPDMNDYNRIRCKYNLCHSDSRNSIRRKIWKVFSTCV